MTVWRSEECVRCLFYLIERIFFLEMETKSYSARDALRTAHFVEFVYDADIERIYMDECKQP